MGEQVHTVKKLHFICKKLPFIYNNVWRKPSYFSNFAL